MISSTVFETKTPVRTSRFMHRHNIYPNMRIHNQTAAYGGSSIGYHAKRIRSDRKSEDEIYVKIAHGSRQTSLLKLEIRSFWNKIAQGCFLKLIPKPTLLYLAAKHCNLFSSNTTHILLEKLSMSLRYNALPQPTNIYMHSKEHIFLQDLLSNSNAKTNLMESKEKV